MPWWLNTILAVFVIGALWASLNGGSLRPQIKPGSVGGERHRAPGPPRGQGKRRHIEQVDNRAGRRIEKR
jgi:hypothetical protein